MRRLILAATVAGSGLLFGLAAAQAQVDYKPIGPSDEGYMTAPDASGLVARQGAGPRVYGYYQEGGERAERLRGYPGGCGTFHFWSGERCVDARDTRR